MCMHVCAHVWVSVLAYVYTYGGQKSTSIAFHLVVWDNVFHKTWSSQTQLASLPSPRIPGTQLHTWLLCGFQGSKLRSSCLYNSHFTHRAISHGTSSVYSSFQCQLLFEGMDASFYKLLRSQATSWWGHCYLCPDFISSYSPTRLTLSPVDLNRNNGQSLLKSSKENHTYWIHTQ